MDLQFEIELDKKDYYNYIKFDTCTDKKVLFTTFSKYFCVIFTVLLVIVKPLTELNQRTFLICDVVFSIILAVISIWGTWDTVANNHAKLQNTKAKWIINDDNFSVEWRVKKEEYKPSSILKAVETKQYFYLYETPNTAFIILKNQINENVYNGILEFINKNNIPLKKYDKF